MEVEIDYLAIGKRIRTARLSKKMTQETLSNMIDVAPTYVSSIENGHTKLSLATLLGIAQSLDTTVDQLLYDNTPVLVSKFDADIKELTSDCSNQEKEFLLEIIKSTDLEGDLGVNLTDLFKANVLGGKKVKFYINYRM